MAPFKFTASFSCCLLPQVHFPQPYLRHFPTLYLISGIALPEGRAGTTWDLQSSKRLLFSSSNDDDNEYSAFQYPPPPTSLLCLSVCLSVCLSGINALIILKSLSCVAASSGGKCSEFVGILKRSSSIRRDAVRIQTSYCATCRLRALIGCRIHGNVA